MPCPEDQSWGRSDSDLRDGLVECVFRSTSERMLQVDFGRHGSVARTALDYSLRWKAY